MRVQLPFQPRWRPAVLSGAKTTTVRTKRFGSAGDEFELDERLFRLVRVEAMALREACARYWREEGMDSAEGFERTWVENHPSRGWRPADTVWVHVFEPAAGAEEKR